MYVTAPWSSHRTKGLEGTGRERRCVLTAGDNAHEGDTNTVEIFIEMSMNDETNWN